MSQQDQKANGKCDVKLPLAAVDISAAKPSVPAKAGFWASIILFFSLLGPGLITGNFGNDAGGITTYSVCGAQFGLKMLWMIIPVCVLLVLYQEMSGRMGAVTGKGLSDLIRENFGIRFAFYLIIGKFFAGMSNAVAEFAGVAASMQLFGVSKYISVPVVAVLIWLLAIKANYRKVEKLFLIGTVFFASYIVAGFMEPLNWREIGRETFNISNISFRHDYFVLFVALIGTTVAPWMVFYHQSAVVEKGIRISDYKYFRWETIASGLSVMVVIFFIIITCSGLHKAGIKIETADQAARALQPLAGDYAFALFGIGLLVASVGAALILPLSTSFSVCEIFGWESGVSKRFNEAPQFYWLFTFQIFIGAAIILIIPDKKLIDVMVISQVVNGVVLPFVLITMVILINKKKVMGQYTNGPVFNAISILATVLITLAIIFMLVSPLFGN
ncbi:MAG: Nramp family divalent metal transporter [Planctomycetes bacterium]|nr:Nramp family divalent metal transporter [Planctomycetota bacterium]